MLVCETIGMKELKFLFLVKEPIFEVRLPKHLLHAPLVSSEWKERIFISGTHLSKIQMIENECTL